MSWIILTDAGSLWCEYMELVFPQYPTLCVSQLQGRHWEVVIINLIHELHNFFLSNIIPAQCKARKIMQIKTSGLVARHSFVIQCSAIYWQWKKSSFMDGLKWFPKMLCWYMLSWHTIQKYYRLNCTLILKEIGWFHADKDNS